MGLQTRTRYLLLVAMVALLVLPGCKKWRAKLGGITVTNPKNGTPEWVVQEAIKCAAEKDEAKAWAKFKTLLHPDQHHNQLSLKQWRRYAWKRFRKHYRGYLKGDQSKFVFKVKRFDTSRKNYRKLFIEHKTKEMPTPILLKKDKQGNWKIQNSSL